MSNWSDLRWFVVFNGIADAYLWGFDADGWRLRHGYLRALRRLSRPDRPDLFSTLIDRVRRWTARMSNGSSTSGCAALAS